MEAKELLEKYPKVTSSLKEWWGEKTRIAMDTAELSEEYKAMIGEVQVNNLQIERTIDGNPHTLFEFFDEYDIHINTYTFIEGYVQYRCYINNEDTNGFITRKDAERTIINEAFEMLEENL